MRGLGAIFCAGMIGAATGCGGNVATSYPEGLAVAGDNPVAPPMGTADNPYPETLNLEMGDGSPNWAMGRGYVHAPIEAVWAALKTPEVCTDRRHLNSFQVMNNVETGYPVSFRVTDVVHNVVTIMFDLTWREGSLSNSNGTITDVVATYQKTFGSTFIRKMYGSVELTPVSTNVTEVSFVQYMDAVQANGANIAAWQQDFFTSLVEVSHGRPLPTY